jgi:hypothetical protein
MNRQQILERETRYATYAAVSAILVAVGIVGSQVVFGQVSLPKGLPTDIYRGFDEHTSTLLLSSLLRAIALALMAVPLVYLFRAAQARSERVNRLMIGFAALPPALLAIETVLFYIGQAQVSSDFVASAGRGGDIYTLFSDLHDDNSMILAAQAIAQAAGLALVVAMIYIPLQAMRTGLLTRFFATLGMALGVASILLPQFTLLPLGLWFGWLGLVFLDRVPNGRPPAWAAGEAIPWPRAGEEPAEPRPAADDVVEGDASEVFAESDQASDHAARRERARKRKRKRRR